MRNVLVLLTKIPQLVIHSSSSAAHPAADLLFSMAERSFVRLGDGLVVCVGDKVHVYFVDTATDLSGIEVLLAKLGTWYDATINYIGPSGVVRVKYLHEGSFESVAPDDVEWRIRAGHIGDLPISKLQSALSTNKPLSATALAARPLLQ